MRELPQYAILTNSELAGAKVISLERPYIIATVFEYHRDDVRAQERMEDMVQERYPIAKVKGYSIYLTMFTSLEPNNDSEFQKAVLNEMAEFFLEEKIEAKPSKYMKCQESGRHEKKITKETHRRIRERRKRTNE